MIPVRCDKSWTFRFLSWTLLLLALPAAVLAQNLEIHHINVGQGTSILIRGANGTTILFDGGDEGRGDSQVVPYLQSQGITTDTPLDFIIASHRDEDHYAGLIEVIDAGYDALTIFDNGSDKTSGAVPDFLAAATRTTAGSVTPMPLGHVIDLGNGARATCVVVNGEVIGSGPVPGAESENDRSVGLLIQYGGFDFFAAGDLGGGDDADDQACTGRSTGQANVETPLVEAIMPGGTHPLLSDFGLEVLHVNHHGSESSTNARVMNRYTPTVAAISVGAGQGSNFRHPRRDVVENVLLGQGPCITAPAALVLQTEEGNPSGTATSFAGFAVGDFVITTDGVSNYTVSANGSVNQGPNELDDSDLPMTFDFDEIVADTTPPLITNVHDENVGATEGEIVWVTDEPATTLLRFGTASGTYTHSIRDDGLVLNHRVTVTGLDPSTTYFYVVESTDVATNQATSSERTYTTSAAAPSTVAINQVFYDAHGPDAGQEWVELFNKTDATIDLSGWILEDNNGTGASLTFPPGSTIAPQTFFTVAANRNEFNSLYRFMPDHSGPLPSLNNAGDALVLRDPSRQIIDAVAWEGGASAGVPSGWGSDTDPVASTGNALVRTDPEVDTGTFADWTIAPDNGRPQTQAMGLPDDTPPIITIAQSITETSAVIVWATNELSDSVVEYGTTAGAFTESESDPSLVIFHSVELTGLTPATTYFFRISSTDAFGNQSPPVEFSFSTQ